MKQKDSPITSASSLLLDRLGVGIGMTMFGKVARKAVFGNCGAIGDTSVVAVVVLDGTSHCDWQLAIFSTVTYGLGGMSTELVQDDSQPFVDSREGSL